MHEGLKRALAEKAALSVVEAHMLETAKRIYAEGFTLNHLNPSQMAAVGEYIRAAASAEVACAAVRAFLEKQLKRLKAKKERCGGNAGPWLTSALADTEGASLGSRLIEALEKAARETTRISRGAVAPLTGVRRLWSVLHGMYRYERLFGAPMPLCLTTSGAQEREGP